MSWGIIIPKITWRKIELKDVFLSHKYKDALENERAEKEQFFEYARQKLIAMGCSYPQQMEDMTWMDYVIEEVNSVLDVVIEDAKELALINEAIKQKDELI